MKALVYRGKGAFAVEERPIPVPKAGETVVRVSYAGICGTDMAIAADKHPRATPPLVPGHEISGRVEAVGGGCSRFQPGDRVVVNPLISCGRCLPCRTGNRHVCNTLGLIGIDCDGGMQQYAVIPEEKLVPTPKALADDEAALVETLAVIVHGVRESGFRFGDAAAVTGAGPIGLLNALVLQRMGASRIFVTELDPWRLERCRAYGFTAVDLRAQDAREVIRGETGGEGADILFECSGSQAAAGGMLELVRCRAAVVMMSVPKQPLAVDLRALNFKEIRLIGSRVYTPGDFAIAAGCAPEMKTELSTLISHRVPLADGARAFEIVRTPGERPLKVLVDCGGQSEGGKA